MSSIKKAYIDIVALLEENKDSKVKTVLPQVIELASAKVGGGGGRGSTFSRNEEGEVVAIKCFYHGKWMSPAVVEFGKKLSAPTGLNSMCKDGVSKWTKQQRTAKNEKELLLQAVASEEIAAADLNAHLAMIEDARNEVLPFTATETVEEGYGFDTLQECLDDTAARGL